MGSVRRVLAALVLAGAAAMPTFAQNLFMPAPFRDPAVTENHELPGASETVPPPQPLVQPLLRAPLPRPRPRMLDRMPDPPADAAATATAAPALASARPALAEPATTGRGQPSAQLAPPPAGAGGQIRIINNTAVAVATMSLIPAKGPAGPHALVANLAPFNVTSASLPAGRGCVFAVQGTFADGSPLAIDNIDLCRDPLINITVW
jgi:hypothetical protein